MHDFATQWLQGLSMQNKDFSGNEKSLQKFLEPTAKPKVIYTNNSLEFGKACEDLSCVRQRLTVPKQMVWQNGQYAG